MAVDATKGFMLQTTKAVLRFIYLSPLGLLIQLVRGHLTRLMRGSDQKSIIAFEVLLIWPRRVILGD